MTGGRVVAFELLAILQCAVLAALAGLTWVFREHPIVLQPRSPAEAAAQTGIALGLTALFALNVAGIAAFELRPWASGWRFATAVQGVDFLAVVMAAVLDRNRYDLGIWAGFGASAGLAVLLLVLIRRSHVAGDSARP